MKTKEIIKRLQQLDPTGELEVTVCSRDILEINVWPSYYDGALEVLQRDVNKSNVADFQIVSAKIITSGQKIVINPISIEELLLDEPELPVEIEQPNTWRVLLLEKWRENGRKFKEQMKNAR